MQTGANAYYRRYIEKVINLDPVTITIKRTVEVETEYGGVKKETVILEPQIVSIYNRRSLQNVVNDAGQVTGSTLARATRLLATADTDISEGDEFEYAGKIWRVVFLQSFMGICHQAELEVIA